MQIMKKWIQKAIKNPGALRRTARRLGLLKGKNDKLTQEDLRKLEAHAKRTGNTTLLRRVRLARTLKKLRK